MRWTTRRAARSTALNTMPRRLIAVAALALLLAAGAVPAPSAVAQSRQGGSAAAPPSAAEDVLGRRVYLAYCATCHGRTGDGWGDEAKGFAQRATDFTKGVYKLRSTVGDVPAPGDLERSIRVGMPGTEMVPFGAVLNAASTQAVARYLRSLNPELADPDATADADDIVKIPAQRPFPRTAETIAAGKEVWESQSCADCHEDDGRGTKGEKDDWDFPVVMVPFPGGYFKSGPTDADLYRSIAAGMKGTTMDGYRDEAEPEEIWQMVDYIRSVGPTQERGFIGGLMDFFFRTRPSGFDYSNY